MAEGVSNTDRDDRNLPPLHKACAGGSLSDAEAAIQQCGYTACGLKDEYGCLPVHYACQHSHDDALDLVKLVSDDCDLNTVACIRSVGNRLHRDCKYHNKQNKPSGQTPLHVACKSGHSDILSFLIDKGSQYLVNCFGQEPIHVACICGNLSVAKLLIEKYGSEICSHQDNHKCLPLHYACQHNSLELVKLVSRISDVNVVACVKPLHSYTYGLYHSECSYNITKNEATGQTPLHIACKAGGHLDIEIIKFLLGKLEHVHQVKNCFNQTLLHIACMQGSVFIARLLIDKCGYGMCTFRDCDQCLPLHYACQHDSLELVKLVSREQFTAISCLKSWHGSTNHDDCRVHGQVNKACGQTPLHIASMTGCVQIVRFILEQKHILNCHKQNLLHVACAQGNMRVAEMIIEKYEYIMCSDQDRYGCLPLHYACQHDSLELVELASNACNVNTLSKDYFGHGSMSGETPLHVACKYCIPAIVRCLCKTKDCNPTICNNEGNIAYKLWPNREDQLHRACQSGVPGLVKYIFQERVHDCMLMLRDPLQSPFAHWPNEDEQLHEACRSGIHELVAYLIQVKKCDPNVENSSGLIPFELWPEKNSQLHIACRYGATQSVIYLVERKKHSIGALVLHEACRSGVPDLVKYLVEERKCDCTIMNRSGKLAFDEWPDGRESLHDACRSGVIQLVEHLLQIKKCDTSIKDSKDQLPLHIMCQENSLRMVRLVSSNCDVNTADSVNEYTPLHIACKEGYVDIAMFLVSEKCCSLSVEDMNGRTPFDLWPSSKDQLQIACTSGFPELVHYLVKQRKCVPSNYQGESVFRLWPKGKEQLHIACKSGIPELVQYVIINRKCDITLRNNDGKVAFELWPKGNMQLHDACRSGVPELVKYLVEERKCDCTIRNNSGKLAFDEWPDGRESLRDACRSGVIQLVEHLLQIKKCDTSIKDSKGQLPLHIMCQENSLRMVRLVSSNCDVNTADSVNEYTPLHIACKEGYVDIAMFLVLEKCCSLSVEDVNGRTPFDLWPSSKDQLRMAGTSGFSELVHYLIKQQKCDPLNYQGERVFRLWPKGKEELHVACRIGISQLVRYLVVSRKCDITLRNSDGKIAFEFWPEGKEQLHEACRSGIPELVKHLICERLCDFKTLNHNKKLAFELWPVSDDQLHEACKSGVLKFVKYLIEERKCDLNGENLDGEIPLHIACQLGYSSFAQMLCTLQNVNITSSNGSTPLHLACDNERKDIVIFLVQQMHAKYNIQDENGELPLHIACRKLTLTEVKLLSDDCDVNTVSRKRERPFDIAVCRNVPDIIRFLVDVRKCDIVINRDDQNPFLMKVRSRLKNMETKPLKLAKLMITGAPRVGKSSFKNRLVGKLMLSLSPSTSAIDAPTLVMMKHITHISATPASRGLPWEEIDIDQQVDNLIESGQSGEADMLLRESVSIHIIDTGGQPEFHKILPILITGPAINLILFKLNEELWERCVIEFIHKDGSFEEPYVTSYTHEDVIFQIISSVSCFTQPSAITYSNKDEQEDMEHIETHCNNAVCVLVGTHKDDLKVTEEVIERANDYLAKKLEKTYANCDGLIEKYHHSTIAAISNKDEDDTKAGIADFRDFLTSLVHKKYQIVDIPPRWFSFQIHIVKSGSEVLKLKDCKAIARKCGIVNDQEFEDVLTYLHYHVGTLLWYRQVMMYKDLVIVDIQSLYDRITELMANTFTKANVHVHDNECKRFKDKGQFTSSVLARQSKKKPVYFAFDHLIHLLQYLHIATCIKKSQSKKLKKETVYFMPCVLRSAEVESLFHSTKAFPHPLLIQFECGFCPVGVFCFLIVELLECSSLKWELCDEETQYSNMIILRAGKDYDKITFIEKNTYYEIRIEPDSQFTEPSLPYHARCHQVKQCMHESLQNVTKRLNYSRLSEHKFAFFCPRRECQQKYCIAVEESMDTKELKCLRCKKPSPVPSQCLYWYGEEGRIKPDDIQRPTTITTSEIDICPLGKFISSLNFVCVVVIPT